MKGGRITTPVKYGFTIIEVMIFLAVSGVTFLIAANFINGKEAQTNFTQSINQINYQVRSIINDVADGNYDVPSNEYVDCIKPGEVSFTSSLTSSTSTGCVFTGKIMVLNSESSFNLLTESGCQYYVPGTGCNSSGNEPQNLTEESLYTVNTQTINWSGSLYMYKAFYSAQPSTTVHAIGILASLPNGSGSQSPLSSSYQPFSIYYSTSTTLTASNAQALTKGGIVMCFSYHGQKGSVTITGGEQSNTVLQLGNTINKSC